MTTDDIIRMAKEAGITKGILSLSGISIDASSIVKFAELVAAVEREACLSIAKSQIDNCFTLLSHPPKSSAAYKIQIAIEARSKPQPETLSPAELRRRTNAPWNDKASY